MRIRRILLLVPVLAAAAWIAIAAGGRLAGRPEKAAGGAPAAGASSATSAAASAAHGPAPSPATSAPAGAPAYAEAPSPATPFAKRWVYVPTNLAVDENVGRVEDIMRRARAAGYTGILFADVKTLTWWTLERPERWKANAARIRAAASGLGLELVVCVFPFGYAEPLLTRDTNLAAGMPIREAPLIRWANRLIPEQTAAIANGSFEEHRGDRAAEFSLQDDPGKGSFIDTRIRREGRASLRFENVGAANRHGHGRAFQKIAVKPWQQYRVRVWMKADRLTADLVQIIALAGKRQLQYQHLSVPVDGEMTPLTRAHDLTTDWVEEAVTFNSEDNATVTIGVGVWGGRTGTVWWDGLRIDSVPTLNVLRRDTAPLALVGENGASYQEGADVDPIVDPKLGRSLWPGTYDTRHEPGEITVPASSRIKEGERVMLSCFHTSILFSEQVCATLNDPKVFDLCAEEIRKTREALSPDGYFMSHDEIRCGGWEPSQVKYFRTSGALLAFNVRMCYEIATREGGGKPVYVWSDMYDPYHNARSDFFLVNNTAAGSWEGLDPKVTIMKWGSLPSAAKSVAFFRKRGNPVMIAAYYDEDVETDRAAWKGAAADPGVVGVMFTTWERDYSNLETFARAWWGAR